MALAQGRHEMNIKKDKKVFQIDLHGFYGVSDAEKFFTDYESNTNSLHKKDYKIVINCKDLSTFKPDILPYLKDAYKAYNEFKEVYFVDSTNPTGKMQLRRIAKEVGLLERFKFVNEEHEIK